MERPPIRKGQRRSAAAVSVICIALILTASLVEVAHFCESIGPRTQVHAGSAPMPGSASTICEICAVSHQVSCPTVTPLAVVVAATAAVRVRAVQPISRLQSFVMDVRPPPSLS